MSLADVKAAITQNNGAIPTAKKEVKDALQSVILQDLGSSLSKLDALRKGDSKNAPVNISFAQWAQEQWGISPDDNGGCSNLYHSLGIDMSSTTLESLATKAEIDAIGRGWLVTEVFREAIRGGLRKRPIYTELIRAEENVANNLVNMPSINMSESLPSKVGELESIPVGSMSFGSKQVKIDKIGKGIKFSDELMRFSNLNLLSIFLEDVGQSLGEGLDNMALTTLLNGDQLGGSDSAGVIGVNTANTIVYQDILRAWIRMQMMGNTPTAIIAGQEVAEKLLLLPEFRTNSTLNNLTPTTRLNMRSALPTSQDIYVHGSVPDGKFIILSKDTGIIKLNAAALRVESERSAREQFDAYYVSLMTGFATLKRDARLVVDTTVTFASNPFPSFFDVKTYERAQVIS